MTPPCSTASAVSQSSAQQPVERRQHPVPQLADRLAAEEARLVRHDAAEGVHERVLELLLGDRAEVAAADLAELRPLLDLVLGRDDPRRLDRPRQVAREHAIEDDLLERLRGGARLPRPSSFSATSSGGTGLPSRRSTTRPRAA